MIANNMRFGLGDAYSDAARARRQQLSPGLYLPAAPQIISLSKYSGKTQDWITVTCDSQVDGLVFLDPNQPGHTVNVDSIEGKPSANSIIFAVPLPGSQSFPWQAGTYQLRAWVQATDNLSPNGVSFSINAPTPMPVLTGPSTVPYVPVGVVPSAGGNGFTLASGAPIPVVHAAGPDGPNVPTIVQQAASTGNIDSSVTTNVTQASGNVQQQTGQQQQQQAQNSTPTQISTYFPTSVLTNSDFNDMTGSVESMFKNPDGSINWMVVGIGGIGLLGLLYAMSNKR